MAEGLSATPRSAVVAEDDIGGSTEAERGSGGRTCYHRRMKYYISTLFVFYSDKALYLYFIHRRCYPLYLLCQNCT